MIDLMRILLVFLCSNNWNFLSFKGCPSLLHSGTSMPKNLMPNASQRSEFISAAKRMITATHGILHFGFLVLCCIPCKSAANLFYRKKSNLTIA